MTAKPITAPRATLDAMALQPSQGPMPGDHYLPSVAGRVRWGWLPNAAASPELTIGDGETVTIDTVSHEGILEDQGRDPVAYLEQFGAEATSVLRDAVDIAASDDPHRIEDGPHIVTGPIAVEGARVGDILKVEVLDLARRVPYGFVSSRHGFGALPGEFPESDASEPTRHVDHIVSMGTVSHFAWVDETGSEVLGHIAAGGDRTVQFPLAPFLGIMGVACATEEPVHSVPPGAHGGNIDIKHTGVGSTLYLPVQVDDALFYAGDPHFAQGNGEVALTAFEASLRATVRLSVLSGDDARAAVGALTTPVVETNSHWIPTGMHEDLNEAMREAVRNAIAFLDTRFGVPRSVALAYLSAAADFEVSQVVDSVKGVHCMISKQDFRRWV